MSRLRPTVTSDTAFYWEGAAREQLLLQRCDECATPRHPPLAACALCCSLAWTAVPASGRGIVHSFVRLHPPLVPGIEVGTVVAVIELIEGPRVVTNLTGDRVEVGARVELSFEDVGDGMKLPQFRLAAGAG